MKFLQPLILVFLVFISFNVQPKKQISSSSSLNYDDVNISFNQLKKDGAWTIQWHVRNNSAEKIEPILISRNYHCNDNQTQRIGASTLGTFLPGVHDIASLEDHGVCPDSKIKLVEIETEIHLNTKQYHYISGNPQ